MSMNLILSSSWFLAIVGVYHISLKIHTPSIIREKDPIVSSDQLFRLIWYHFNTITISLNVYYGIYKI